MSTDAKEQLSEQAEETASIDQLAWTTEEEQHLVRKLDIRIFPVIIVLFILNFIDRNNFANARLKVRLFDRYTQIKALILDFYIGIGGRPRPFGRGVPDLYFDSARGIRVNANPIEHDFE